MPSFHFRLEDDFSHRREWVLDCPDASSAILTGKHVARQMVASRARTGNLRLAQDLLIESETGEVLGRLPLGQAIAIS